MDRSPSAATGPARARYPRSAHRSAVAAGSTEVVDAAAAVLEDGGNAVDAAVAGALAATIAEPILASLGGGGFCLVREATGESHLVDFFVTMPGLSGPAHNPSAMEAVDIDFGSTTQTFHVGPASVATPAMVPGLRHLAERFGNRPLKLTAQPAIELARRGAVVDEVGAKVLSLVWRVVGSSDRGRAMFASANSPDRPLRAGERYRFDGYADVLDELASGGDLSASALGGGISPRDLADYRVVERVPLQIPFRGSVVQTNPAPSFGGALLAHALCGVTDPATRPIDVATWAEANRAMTLERDRLGSGTSRGTTHISVVDSTGMAASLTTSNGSGSGVFVDGTPIQLNNMLGEDDLHPGGFGGLPAGMRIGSMMAPLVIERPDGSIVAAGSGGSERIRSALLALLLRLLDRDESLASAVDGPRLHWDGSQLQVEPGFDTPEADALAEWGPATTWPQRDFYFGGVHAAAGAGESVAVGDQRRGGAARVVHTQQPG